MTKKNGNGKSQYATLTPDTLPLFKNFVLVRSEDETGISGTGIVAVGIMFPSGEIFMEWTSPIKSHEHFHSVAELDALHGHKGKTVVQWLEK